MIDFALNKRLAVLLMGAAFTGALVPGASAESAGSKDRIYVNPSTGFATVHPSHRDASSDLPPGYTRRYVGSTLSVVPVHEATASAAPQPTVDEPSGFDWPSAAIGAAATGGLLLILMTAMVGAGRTGRGPLASQRAVGT
jgi:hypothetical protein